MTISSDAISTGMNGNKAVSDTAIENGQLIQGRVKKLREDTDFISSLMENVTGYAIIASDFDGNVFVYNEGARQIYGYSPEEVIDRLSIDTFFADEVTAGEKLQQIVDELIEKGRFFSEEEPLVRKNGEIFPARLTFTVTKDKLGKAVGFVGIAEDLTNRKKEEKRLNDTITNFFKVADNNADGIIIANLEGIIRYVNPAAEALFGRKNENLHGRKFEFPLSPGTATEIDIISKAGEIIVTEMQVVETVWNDETCLLASLRDITERNKAHQAQERLARQLQDQISELEVFIYGIAKDLKTPLFSVQGFSRLLREDMQNNQADKVQEDIRQLESGVRKMQHFLNRTLEYSHAGNMGKQSEDVAFGEIVEEVIKGVDQQVCSIRATVSCAETFPRVRVDRARIVQMLTNLIQNSINYRDKTVPLKIEFGHLPSENEVVFFVRDNGIGIDEIETEKVFDLFYRSTAEGEGCGVGLAIVKRIIEAHGGNIWIEQGQVESGTTMCFTLPKERLSCKGDDNE